MPEVDFLTAEVVFAVSVIEVAFPPLGAVFPADVLLLGRVLLVNFWRCAAGWFFPLSAVVSLSVFFMSLEASFWFAEGAGAFILGGDLFICDL